MNHLNNDKNINEIVRTVKELFVKSVSNQNELSLLIDKYLIPQDIEKKKNAEVSTPYKLRNEMLDKMPIEFWNKPQKVFEPCSGKGGFLIDIINRFMIGLKDLYPDEKERYKFIVEECLYWCDINPTNIFICKLLIDPYNEYKINYHEGNTLELDVKDKWGLEGFDGVIGNPPYNNGKNSNFYVKFMTYGYNILKYGGCILYVIPNRFLIPKHKANKEIVKFQVYLIKHTTDYFKVSTDIGYFFGKKNANPINDFVTCIFKNKYEYHIDLSKPTPTANNSCEYKKLSDKILKKKNKIEFIKNKKHLMNTDKFIFTPRHWTRYATSKKKGGGHVFNIVDEFGDDGRFIEVNENTKKNIIWYLTRSKVIRFITNNYASTVFIPPFIWESIPSVDFMITYTDFDLYKLFNFNKSDIEMIENVVD
jgi:hypothetical protein